MRAVAYLRVSTDEQDVSSQRFAIERWASERGVEVVAWFEDDAVSGGVSPWERPGFRRLIEYISNNKDTRLLLVYELSRLARDLPDLISTISRLEREFGVYVISVSPTEQGLATLDPYTRQLILVAMGQVAQIERDLIRQRTKAAMARLRAEGKIFSVVDYIPREMADQVVEMRLAGMSLRDIAKATGLSLHAVRRILAQRGIGVDRYTCPRCFHRMKVVSRGARMDNGSIVLVEKVYCPKCGYETIR